MVKLCASSKLVEHILLHFFFTFEQNKSLRCYGLLKIKFSFKSLMQQIQFFVLLNITRRHGSLRGPTFSSCRGLRPAIFGIFWCPLVTLVTFSSNLSNFERNPKKPKKNKKKKWRKKIQKIWKSKSSKKSKNFKKSKKSFKKKTSKKFRNL